jgi:hypothetical protein
MVVRHREDDLVRPARVQAGAGNDEPAKIECGRDLNDTAETLLAGPHQDRVGSYAEHSVAGRDRETVITC